MRKDYEHIKALADHVRAVLTDELRRPPWRGHKNKLAGHCYVASEAMFHLLGGHRSEWQPQFVRAQTGDPHWFLRSKKTRVVIDVTAEQFNFFQQIHNVWAGRPKGFLTRSPSKRAKEVLRRVRERQSSEHPPGGCFSCPPTPSNASSSPTRTASKDSRATSLS